MQKRFWTSRVRMIAASGILSLALSACVTETPENLGVSSSQLSASEALGSDTGETSGLRLVSSLPLPPGSRQWSEDVVLVGDVLQMDVFGVEKLNRTVQVNPAGQIALPLVGVVGAAGKSVTALERDITSRYAQSYLQSPNIAIQIKESAVRRVIVDGEVNKPGAFAVSSRSTLMEAVAQAAGLKDTADPAKVYVYRTIGSAKLVANYSVADIRSGQIGNPPILGGDVVIVFSSSTKVAWQNLKDALGVARNVASFSAIH